MLPIGNSFHLTFLFVSPFASKAHTGTFKEYETICWWKESCRWLSPSKLNLDRRNLVILFGLRQVQVHKVSLPKHWKQRRARVLFSFVDYQLHFQQIPDLLLWKQAVASTYVAAQAKHPPSELHLHEEPKKLPSCILGISSSFPLHYHIPIEHHLCFIPRL